MFECLVGVTVSFRLGVVGEGCLDLESSFVGFDPKTIVGSLAVEHGDVGAAIVTCGTGGNAFGDV